MEPTTYFWSFSVLLFIGLKTHPKIYWSFRRMLQSIYVLWTTELESSAHVGEQMMTEFKILCGLILKKKVTQSHLLQLKKTFLRLPIIPLTVCCSTGLKCVHCEVTRQGHRLLAQLIALCIIIIFIIIMFWRSCYCTSQTPHSAAQQSVHFTTSSACTIRRSSR